MNQTPRIATHLGPFSSASDRYNPKGYKEGVPVEARIRQAATVEGLDAVELNFRGLVNEETAPAVKKLLDEGGWPAPMCRSTSGAMAAGRWGRSPTRTRPSAAKRLTPASRDADG